MKHDFLDKYSYLDTPIHRLPAMLKLILVLVYILWLTSLKNGWVEYCLAGGGLLILILFSQVPLTYLFLRSLVIVPFLALILIFMAISQPEPGEFMLFVSLRAWLSVLALVWLISTTPFPELLKAMRKLRIPSIILTLLGFIYRYFFLLSDEGQRMFRSVKMRSFGKKKSQLEIKTYAQILGTLFLRSYERSERVYQAMLMRGFTEEGR